MAIDNVHTLNILNHKLRLLSGLFFGNNFKELARINEPPLTHMFFEISYTENKAGYQNLSKPWLNKLS